MYTLKLANLVLFLSTLSLRRATDVIAVMTDAQSISIHALLAESDSQQPAGTTRTTYFYPRSPCGERLDKRCKFSRNNGFLSTLSLRRATITIITTCTASKFLSTLSLRRATIHYLIPRIGTLHFYPRSPCGERLGAVIELQCVLDFYPRSPCGERPLFALLRYLLHHDFYPRSPCGERLFVFWTAPSRPLFLSTLSLRRATIR